MKAVRRWVGGVFIIVLMALLGGCAADPGRSIDGELPTLSDQTEVQRRASIRLQLAAGYYEQRQQKVALDEIKHALSLYPDYADAYGLRAIIYMGMGEMRLADENFTRAMRLAPKNPDLSSNYGWFLCQDGRAEQSIAHFEAAISNKSYQSPAKALNNAGICSLRLKDRKAAERYFSRAFQYDPSNPVTNGNLAKLFFDRNDYERARFYIGRVIQAEVLTADVLWLAIKIERKRGDQATEAGYVAHLRRRHPNSPEYAAYQRGAFDE